MAIDLTGPPVSPLRIFQPSRHPSESHQFDAACRLSAPGEVVGPKRMARSQIAALSEHRLRALPLFEVADLGTPAYRRNQRQQTRVAKRGDRQGMAERWLCSGSCLPLFAPANPWPRSRASSGFPSVRVSLKGASRDAMLFGYCCRLSPEYRTLPSPQALQHKTATPLRRLPQSPRSRSVSPARPKNKDLFISRSSCSDASVIKWRPARRSAASVPRWFGTSFFNHRA